MTITFANFVADEDADTTALRTTEQTASAHVSNAGLPLAAKLEAVTSRAIDKIDQILALPLDRDDACFGNVLRAQTAAANTALSTQAKVDEQQLRTAKCGEHTLERLIDLINEARANRPMINELERKD
jgi:hypothetical protein